MANCETCKEKKTPPTVPYVVHEAEMARSERHIKRLWIALIIAVLLMFASNIGWLIYEAQFDTLAYEQDGEGINNVNYGEQGDLNNGAEGQNKEEEEQKER